MFLDKSTTTNIADFIQPSLGQLQPNLDEFMDTIEPLQGTYNTDFIMISVIMNNMVLPTYLLMCSHVFGFHYFWAYFKYSIINRLY